MKGSEAHAGMLSPVIHALTALLRGEWIYKIELFRCDALGMLGHLLAACPPQTVNADLLAAFCALESALEGSGELSDQLLHRIFLRLSLWSHGGLEIMQPLLRQLCRMASERHEQWARTDALSRLIDAMLEAFPWQTRSIASAPSAADASSTDTGDPATRRSYTETELHALWDGAFDVLCSAADTNTGITMAQLRYVVHSALRSGSRGVLSSLIRVLVSRTYTLDLRLIELLVDGGNGSLAFALLTCLHQGELLGEEGAPSEELRSIVVRLIGRLVVLGSDDKLSAAVRWVGQTTWSKCGWSWLGFVLSGAPTEGELLEAATEVLLGTVREPQRALSTAAQVVDVSDGRHRNESLEDHISLSDESAQAFSNPQLLVPLLHLSSNAAPTLQRSLVLNLSLWLRHSTGALNQALLTNQPGWQLPICSMLNGSGDDTEDMTFALCVRLMSEHLVSTMRRASAAVTTHGVTGCEEGWAEVLRTISFVETHTAEAVTIKQSIFAHVLELLRGKVPLPKANTPSATTGRGAEYVAGSGPQAAAAAALSAAAERAAESALAMWGLVLRLAILLEESLSTWDSSAWLALNPQASPEHQPKSKGSLVSRLLTGGSRPAASSSSTRTPSASTMTTVGELERRDSASMTPSTTRSNSFTVELEAEAAVARLLGDTSSAPPTPLPTIPAEANAPSTGAADLADAPFASGDGGNDVTSAAAASNLSPQRPSPCQTQQSI